VKQKREKKSRIFCAEKQRISKQKPKNDYLNAEKSSKCAQETKRRQGVSLFDIGGVV